MKTFFLIVIIFFALIASFLLGRQSAGENASVRIVVVRDTVTDTIRSIRPVPVKTVIARHDTLRLPVIETRTDSVLVSLPVERKTYSDDSTYTAVVMFCEIKSIISHFLYLHGYELKQRTLGAFLRTTAITLAKRKSPDLGEAIEEGLNSASKEQ